MLDPTNNFLTFDVFLVITFVNVPRDIHFLLPMHGLLTIVNSSFNARRTSHPFSFNKFSNTYDGTYIFVYATK